MPAVTTDNILALPVVAAPDPAASQQRPVRHVARAERHLEGAGFEVRRAFPSTDVRDSDPFLLLDHLGAVEYAPGEPKGAPWHPHRGFETVTYIIDGAIAHHDSTGGGGLIADGATQWMTAGAGILHDEVPPEWLVQRGGLFHGVQLWVNLPRSLKMTPPRYQDIGAGKVVLLRSSDGGALIRLIAGDLSEGSHSPQANPERVQKNVTGPGSTWTPITYAHATISPGARLQLPWRTDFNAMVYVLSGKGSAGLDARPIEEGEIAVFGPGDSITVDAAPQQDGRSPSLEVLILGGKPIREPTVFYGPFVMNTRQEIFQAVEDYHAGRMGQVPAITLDVESKA